MMLEGIRVLDLSHVIADPYRATLMADLAAA
jgi:crotonobetainyl-CoA:carnitine CoA-transferase CaiB-like acyl-CoA transferase